MRQNRRNSQQSQPLSRDTQRPNPHGRRIRISSSTSRSLIWVDAEPLLKRERRECQKAFAKLERIQATLRVFQDEVQPAFMAWVHGTFGKELTDLREQNRKLAELGSLVQEVESYAFVMGCSLKSAYAQIMKEREMRRNAPHEHDENDHAHRHNHDHDNRDRDRDYEREEQEPHPEEEEFAEDNEMSEADLRFGFEMFFGSFKQFPGTRAEYEAIFEEFKEEYRTKSDAKRRSQSREEIQSPNKAESHEHTRLKDAYRSLAKKLHPDQNPNLPDHLRELWHQACEAYQEGNLERLETLAAHVQALDQNWESITGLSGLQALKKDLARQIRSLEREVRQTKKDRAWGFDQTRKNEHQLNNLKREIHHEISLDASTMREEIEELERRIESWKRKHPSQKRQPRRQPGKQRPSSRKSKERSLSPEELKRAMDEYTGFGKKL